MIIMGKNLTLQAYIDKKSFVNINKVIIIIVYGKDPLFHSTIFFTFASSKTFLPCNVSHAKQAAVFSFPLIISAISAHPLLRGLTFS